MNQVSGREDRGDSGGKCWSATVPLCTITIAVLAGGAFRIAHFPQQGQH